MKAKLIEWVIVFFTLVLIAAVIVIGNVTYRGLKKIENQSDRVKTPSNTIILVKQIISEIRNCESNVYSYNLYKNEEYLLAYDESSELIAEHIDSLRYIFKTDEQNNARLDSIDAYLKIKFDLLNEHLNIRNDQKLLNELNRINQKLDSIKLYDHKYDAKKPEEKKKNIFKRIFKPKSKKDTVDHEKRITDSLNAITRGSLNKVRAEVSNVKNSQGIQLEDMKTKELELISRNNVVMNRLLFFVAEIEKSQNDKLKLLALDNIEQSRKTNNFISIFGTLIVILMVSLVTYSIYYLYRSAKYRNKLKETAKIAQELAKSKEYFLATMSHEIRTPLNSIVGFSEQLLGTTLNTDQEKQISIIYNSSNHLLEIVNDVLDFSKIEAGKIELEKISFSPLKEIEITVELMSARAEKKNIKLIFNKDNSFNYKVIGDPLRLRQIVLNLLSNSIKFTEKGEIVLEVKLERNELSKTTRFICTLKDSGIGIPKDRINTIFESFTQADNSTTRKYGGTGLGLSITKKLIDLQQGNIHIESTEGEGTSIHFVIPYVTDESAKESNTEVKKLAVSKKLKDKRILVADDQEFNRILISTIAKKHKFILEEAENGKMAVDLNEKNDYDLILMDLRMPELSGIDATSIIRKNENKKKAQVPIIALTATSNDDKMEDCLQAGMNEMLSKPFSEKNLIETLEKFIA